VLRRLEPCPDSERIAFTFEGETVTAPAGGSVAAALLAHGVAWFKRAPRSGSPRAPYCLMGACFECTLVIDGRRNRQSCLTPVEAGMLVEREPAR
jgi:D-hydroxyproline dehydrogenase subunit gamma